VDLVKKSQQLNGLNPIYVFVMPPSLKSLEDRLRSRGTETEESLAIRLRNAEQEMAHAPKFDHVIINDDLEVTYNKLLDIVTPELSGV
jgi:guanylate kinase